jgi:hypothetical protein
LVDSYGGDVVAWNPAASPPLQKITPLTPNTGVFTIACPNVSLCLASDDRGHEFTSTDPTGGISTWAATKLESQGGLLIADCPTQSLCFVVDAAGKVFVGTHLTAPDVRAQLRAELTPTKQTARIESLLKGDGAVLNFTAPGAGRLRISWYAHRPRHSHVSHRGAPETLVATGGWSYARAGAGRVRIMLTHEGRQILEHSNRIKVTGRYRFMPTGGRSIDAAQTFTLKR